MNTQNYPLLFEAKNLNGLNFGTKEISGKNYRINNFSIKDYTTKNINTSKGKYFNRNNKIDNNNNNNENNDNNNNNNKNFNVDLFKKILSDDDATSGDDNYSNNFSSDEESNFNILESKDKDREISNNDNYNNLGVFAFDNYLTNTNKNFNNCNFKWTHFLAIPFTKMSKNLGFMEKFYYFKNKILDEGLYDEDESIFQIPERLHMTLCMLEIKSEKDLNNLKKLLQNIKPILDEISLGEDIYLHFEALEVFGKPHDSRVMYSKPKINESNKLFDLLDLIYSNLLDKKFLQKDQMRFSNILFNEENQRYEKEKLHITLMNTSFLNREREKDVDIIGSNSIPIRGFGSNLGEKKGKESYNFNGLKILKKMNNFGFGSHKINEICLYQMQIDQKTNNFKLIEKIDF
jgi:2'-5' RNA ligase